MTAIVAVFPKPRVALDAEAPRRMLARMASRGGRAGVDVWHDDRAALGVGRFAWERGPGAARGAQVVVQPECVVVADAALYYRDELRRRLRGAGVEPRGESAAHLIAAAYRAWGDRCAEALEGDFAFVVWDPRRDHVVFARAFVGLRPLYYADTPEQLVVASSASAIAGYLGGSALMSEVSVAASAAGLFNATTETAYRGVHVVPAAWGAVSDHGGRLTLAAHWLPPRLDASDPMPFDEAALELRRLMRDAVGERLAHAGDTAVWLSGGWDSTAVFGSGQGYLQATGDRRALLPASLSYPIGDPGREDELIAQVANRWNAAVDWTWVPDVPLLAPVPGEAAAARDVPFAHPFEMVNRALAARARELGCAVSLMGIGGDQLFAVSDSYLADLLRHGQWRELLRDWRIQQGRTLRGFYRRVLQPALPEGVRGLLGRMRGGAPVARNFERQLPDWISRQFAARHDLLGLERRGAKHGGYDDVADEETYRELADRFGQTIFCSLGDLGMEEGTEIRFPILDTRVVRFAFTRPRRERASGAETKVLLRGAMRGLVPDNVLAPRSERTGSSRAYFAESMRGPFRALGDDVFRDPVLAQLGIADGDRMRKTWTDFVDERGGLGGLHWALQTELWVRARVAPERLPEFRLTRLTERRADVGTYAAPWTATPAVLPLGEPPSTSLSVRR